MESPELMKPLMAICLIAGLPCFLPAQEVLPLQVVEPSAVSVVTSREPGFLEALEVSLGDRVQEGRLLAKLDHERQLHAFLTAKVRAEDRSGIQIAEGELREKNANLSDVQNRHRRRQAEDEDVEKAMGQVQVARGKLEQARVNMELDKLALELAEQLLENRHIRAPIAGTVVNISIPKGGRVNPGDPVVTIADMENLTTSIPISKDSLGRVAVGSSIPVRMPGSEILHYAQIESIDPIEGAPDGQHAMKLIFKNMSPKTPLAALALEAVLPEGVKTAPVEKPKPPATKAKK